AAVFAALTAHEAGVAHRLQHLGHVMHRHAERSGDGGGAEHAALAFGQQDQSANPEIGELCQAHGATLGADVAMSYLEYRFMGSGSRNFHSTPLPVEIRGCKRVFMMRIS